MPHRLTDAEVDDLLRSDALLRLGTVDATGYPHLTPLWFLWDGEMIYATSRDGSPHVRSRGGFRCKIYLTVEGLGNPLRVILTPGQRHESTQAEALIDGFTFEKILADRGYAGAEFIAYVQDHGSEAVIPPHQRAKVKREYDPWVYRERHLVECCFNKLKHFRRIFSRFDKLDPAFRSALEPVL